MFIRENLEIARNDFVSRSSNRTDRSDALSAIAGHCALLGLGGDT